MCSSAGVTSFSFSECEQLLQIIFIDYSTCSSSLSLSLNLSVSLSFSLSLSLSLFQTINNYCFLFNNDKWIVRCGMTDYDYNVQRVLSTRRASGLCWSLLVVAHRTNIRLRRPDRHVTVISSWYIQIVRPTKTNPTPPTKAKIKNEKKERRRLPSNIRHLHRKLRDVIDLYLPKKKLHFPPAKHEQVQTLTWQSTAAEVRSCFLLLLLLLRCCCCRRRK